MFTGLTPAPDRTFVKKLRNFDPTLRCEFDRKIEKFVITQPRKLGGRAVAGIVEGDSGGGYRQPDNRDLQALVEADFHRKSVKRRILEGEEHMKRVREEETRKERSEIRDVTKDNRIQLANTYVRAFNLGKGRTGFRQITPKPKGKVFK